MKLAYFSPLSPQRSGISDYSEELLPHLADGAEITLFVDGFQPMNRELTSRFEVLDYRRQRSHLNRLADFDAVVYQMGNDHRYHAGMFEAMKRRRGIVVFHDFALHDFFLGLTRESRDLRVYLDEVGHCHGEAARAEAAEALGRGATPAIVSRPIEFPLNCRIANSAEGMIVHSEWSRSRFVKIAPNVRVARISMPLRFAETRTHRSDSTNEIKIASFGLVTPGKGIERALRALSKLKRTHRFRYSLVGETNNFYDVRELIRRYQMDECVEITGHITLDEFKRLIDETDIALNIRERTVGETSASLCRLMAAGVCGIVADVGWYAELPNDSVVKIPLDAYADTLLLAYLTRLIEDEPLRQRIGENARRFARTEHTVERGAAAYLDFIREVIDGRARRQLISNVKDEIAMLGVRPSDELFLRAVAEELATIAPETIVSANGGGGSPKISPNGKEHPQTSQSSFGRTPKIEGIDYKQAAIEYPGRLDPERRHYLLTKPFYNLANKPRKHTGEGMDAETVRHFCDFANMAAALALAPTGTILDIGCGSGWLSEYFARLGYVVKGIDISPDLIEMSRERVARVPYGADHKTPLRCTFAVHDVELAPLPEKFDAVICYDSLHHFEDERAMISNIASMLNVGGVLFILEGDRPAAESPTEAELEKVMREFGTLESPFDYSYLRQLLEENGFAMIGDYVSVNGLFAREAIEDDLLPLKTLDTDYHYLLCKKVVEGAHASTVKDSRRPGILRARLSLISSSIMSVAPVEEIELELEIQNIGDTLWLAGSDPRAGIVMPAVRITDDTGLLVSEFHGQPPLSRAVAPGETIVLKIGYTVPQRPGTYTFKLDLVNQHVCWFEDQGSEPFITTFEVVERES
jgi:2-polyprenyl-3-methyl-5-hydroxy-6-metoxy-1,4-benzoquinol methylase/glycosyltransferase involved in cell wall biosynthesis